MKINLVTYHWSNNLGALIQALSLKDFINKNFNAVIEYNNYLPKKLIKRERMSQINSQNFSFLNKIFKKKLKLYFWKKNIGNIKSPISNTSLFDKDIYIYGSDEIWNYSNPFFGFDPYFFGDLNKKKKIAYGCSIGNANIKLNSINQEQKIKQNLQSFNAISVRDSNSFSFIQNLIKLEPEIVVDPCFLSTPDVLFKYNTKFKEKFEKKNFILIYGDFFSKNEINKIINFSKKENLSIISVSYVNRWADLNIIDINPADLVFFIKSSTFVITSMFHGVMLSYKFNKQFWYSEDPYRKNKLKYFLEKLNLKNQQIEFLSVNQIDYKYKEKEFKLWKKKSGDFLLNNIKNVIEN